MNKLYFRVSGERITEIARDLFSEQGWDQATRFLVQSLSGFDLDDAEALLRGRKNLVGMSPCGVRFEDGTSDDIKEAADREEWLYAGLIQRKGLWWRPYAVIGECLGSDDARGAGKIYSRWYQPVNGASVNSGRRGMRCEAWAKARACHYMDDQYNDRVEFVRATGEGLHPDQQDYPRDRMVLFSLAPGGPPAWRKVATEWQTAVDEYRAVHPLEVRQWDHRYESTAAAELEALGSGVKNEDLIEARKTGEPVATTDAEAFAKGMIEELKTFSLRPIEMPHTGGWVLRDGRGYGCPYHRHKDLAKALLGKRKIELADDDAEITADAQGWLRIRHNATTGEVEATIDQRPSTDQRAYWEAWCAEQGVDTGRLVEAG